MQSRGPCANPDAPLAIDREGDDRAGRQIVARRSVEHGNTPAVAEELRTVAVPCGAGGVDNNRGDDSAARADEPGDESRGRVRGDIHVGLADHPRASPDRVERELVGVLHRKTRTPDLVQTPITRPHAGRVGEPDTIVGIQLHSCKGGFANGRRCDVFDASVRDSPETAAPHDPRAAVAPSDRRSVPVLDRQAVGDRSKPRALNDSGAARRRQHEGSVAHLAQPKRPGREPMVGVDVREAAAGVADEVLLLGEYPQHPRPVLVE